MKIAYVSLHWPRLKTSSIGKKITNQLYIWRGQGHSVEFFSHMHDGDTIDGDLVKGLKFIYPRKSGFIGAFRTEFERIVAARRLIKAVKEYNPDAIYLRWAMYVFSIHQLARIAPIILEINTLDLLEHKRLGKILSGYNQMTREILLKNSTGLVFPTNELAQHKSFGSFHKPFRVIPNGIDIHSISSHGAPNNKTPRLVFIGTAGMPWQGVDKLVGFATNFQDIQVDLAGFEEEDLDVELPDNLRCHSYLTGLELEEILSKADAAIGTMALHRKGMQEASPLKVRDYLARGIPSILPYRDTALEDLQISEILKIPNTPENLVQYGNSIHDFVYSMRGKRVDTELIKDRINAAVLEAKRLDFIGNHGAKR